jgi:hypothetical protein
VRRYWVKEGMILSKESVLASIAARPSAIHHIPTLDYIDIQAYEAMGFIKDEKRR